MNNEEKPKEVTDEIGDQLESGDEVNAALEQQGDDADAGILRDTDAAKQQKAKEDDNQELQGAP